jgi:hypothetical protein
MPRPSSAMVMTTLAPDGSARSDRLASCGFWPRSSGNSTP